MHELSLCHGIADVVERARQGRPVATVHLRIGHLRQVVPDTLVFCWELTTADGPLAGSVLDIDHVPVTLACRACGSRTTVAHALVLTCAACGSGDIEVTSGEEFLVVSLDLAPGAPSYDARGEDDSDDSGDRDHGDGDRDHGDGAPSRPTDFHGED